MQIYIRLYGGLDRLNSHIELREDGSLDVHEGTTIQDLLKSMGISLERAPILLVNGINKRPSYQLKEGDRLCLFPLLGGG